MRTMLTTVRHQIGGAATSGMSVRTAPVWNPATGERQAEVLLAESGDVDAAVLVARDAYRAWCGSSVSRRARVMFAFRNLVREHTRDLALIVSREHGKVVADAMGEIARGLDVIEFACGIAQALKGEYSEEVSTDIDLYSFRQPLGVCAGITPFNFPVMVPLWMHPIAIACGNAFVLKPSERDPSASNFIAELYAEAGLPAGVFNVVHGDRVAVDRILDHPDIAAVSFVGSTPIARYVYERGTRSGKRVQALGGAKNHAVVLPDADLEFAAENITAAAYGSAGERCMAISAVVAVGAAADPLLERLARKAARLKVGPGSDERSDMGPVVTAAARDRIAEYITRGAASGARLVVDGRDCAVEGHPSGFYVGPTIFDRVTTDMELYRDEIFGPVLVVLRVDSLEAAIGLINQNAYGNGAALFTSSGRAARAFQRDVEVGMIGINVPIPVPMAYYSFGGWKSSLFGDHHVHGPEGVRFYTRGKAVTSRWPGDEPRTTSPARLHFPTSA